MATGGGVLTYFPTFVPEFKNDKIPNPLPMSGGGGGGGILTFGSARGASLKKIYAQAFIYMRYNYPCFGFR